MFEKIKELIAEELGADAATITKETTFDATRPCRK